MQGQAPSYLSRNIVKQYFGKGSKWHTIQIWVIDSFIIIPNVLFFQAKLYA